MAYLRLNRYQLELVHCVRVEGKPKTIVLHRFNQASDMSQLDDPKLKRALEKKTGGKIDARALIARGESLAASSRSSGLDRRAPEQGDRAGSSMQTMPSRLSGATIQTLPVTLPSGVEAPELWKQYVGFRSLLDPGSYAQAMVALYEFLFLFRLPVEPCVYRNQAMLRVQGKDGSRVIFPVSVLLSVLRHGAAITKVMWSTHGKGERFWEEAEVSCKTYFGEWLTVEELGGLLDSRYSLQEFSGELSKARAWLRCQSDKTWIQEALAKVGKGRMRREVLQKKLIAAGAPESGEASWLVWERAIYGLGPVKPKHRR